MSTPASIAALIGGIRAAQPGISAAAIEALLHIADGADCKRDLQQRMQADPSTISRIVSQLTGRGTLGKRACRSRLRLVERRKHPHHRGSQLLLSAEGRGLVGQSFGQALRK